MTASERDNATMKSKLTDFAIRAYKPRAAQFFVGDASCPGLRLRVTPNGVKTFVFAFRNKVTGKVTGLALGRFPDMGLAEARERASDHRKSVADGKTPTRPLDEGKKA